MGLKDKINKLNLLKTTTVDVPEIGEFITLKEMNVTQVRELLNKIAAAKAAGNDGETLKVLLYAFVQCAVDEEGNRCFEDTDVEWLSSKLPFAIFSKITTATMEHAMKIGGEAAKVLQAEVEKNSETALSIDSASA